MDNPLSLTTKADGPDIAGDPKAERAPIAELFPFMAADGGHSGGYWSWSVCTAQPPLTIRVENARGRNQAIALAKFIDAAPDLYAALEAIEMETRNGGQWTFAEINELARRVLSQARGEK